MDCFALLAMTVLGCLKIEIPVHANTLVMAGLDPAIHQSSQKAFPEGDGLPGQARQ
jgi:hypothetical protein